MLGGQSLENFSSARPKFAQDSEGFVKFGDVSRSLLHQQSQYSSRYLGGWEKDGYPNLANGIRLKGQLDNYHDLRIHADDVEELVRRIQDYKN